MLLLANAEHTTGKGLHSEHKKSGNYYKKNEMVKCESFCFCILFEKRANFWYKAFYFRNETNHLSSSYLSRSDFPTGSKI